MIRVEQPGEQKRIEILQLYSHNLCIHHQIPWSYLANRTVGLTAADLAVAMNYSSLKAILQGSGHTIETIEYGLNSIARFSNTSSISSINSSSLLSALNAVASSMQMQKTKSFSSNFLATSVSPFPERNKKLEKQNRATRERSLIKPSLRLGDEGLKRKHLVSKGPFADLLQESPLFAIDSKLGVLNRQFQKLKQIAYYQAGKVMVQTLLPQHPPVPLVTLNLSGITTSTSADIYVPIDSAFTTYWCSYLESRLIGLYS